jgi:hypothetical protein
MKNKMTMKVLGLKKEATELYINYPVRNFTNLHLSRNIVRINQSRTVKTGNTWIRGKR